MGSQSHRLLLVTLLLTLMLLALLRVTAALFQNPPIYPCSNGPNIDPSKKPCSPGYCEKYGC